MLHFVHQLVANCVCLLFGAEQVVYSGFLEFYHWKQLPAASGKNAIRVMWLNKNSRLENNELKMCNRGELQSQVITVTVSDLFNTQVVIWYKKYWL